MNPGGLGILDKNFQKVQLKIQTTKLRDSSLGLFEPNFYIIQPVHHDTAIGCWISASHIFLFNQWKWKFWIWGSVLVLEEMNTITSACSWVLVLNIESCMQQWGLWKIFHWVSWSWTLSVSNFYLRLEKYEVETRKIT